VSIRVFGLARLGKLTATIEEEKREGKGAWEAQRGFHLLILRTIFKKIKEKMPASPALSACAKMAYGLPPLRS
jgi:hypothetical protein